jgi:SAM-dependent MidA family methyltransferase
MLKHIRVRVDKVEQLKIIIMANELFKALAKKQGKDKSMSILKQMTAGGKMPADLTNSMYTGGGSVPVPSMMQNPMAEMAKGGENEYGYGGTVKGKKKKSKKKK